MKKYILTFTLLAFGLSLFSQSYNTSLGMRLGTDWGVTLNQRVLKRVTVEAIGQSSLQRDEFMLTGLGKHHFPIISRRFNIYFGGGLHKGWNSNPEIQDPWGMDLVGGIEFTAARINISYDFKPAFNFSGRRAELLQSDGDLLALCDV